MFKKKQDAAQTSAPKQKKPRVYKANTKRLPVIALWVLLAGSLTFAIYKNFTAVDTHTVTETTVIETEVVDTNKIENFVFNFAKVYYAWDETSDSLAYRTTSLQFYMTSELQALNLDSVRADIATTSKVQAVQIWSVTPADENSYDVVYTVSQLISDAENSSTVTSVYEVTVYVDDNGDIVIIKNPTITSKPSKSDYEPKAKENDATVDATTISEISEFLTTFFRLYPTATVSEIAYYANDGVMPVVGKDYSFMDLVNPLYSKNGDTVSVSLAVKYLDNKTKMVQISQFELTLQKTNNTWKIVG